VQAQPVERPAGPVVAERAQVATAQQPQQTDRAERYARAAGLPVVDGAQPDAEEGRARLARQQAAVPEGAEAFGRDVPNPGPSPTLDLT
jgi:hypothetical protein